MGRSTLTGSETGTWGGDVDMAIPGLPGGVVFRAISAAEDALRRELDLINLDDDNLFTQYLKRKGKLQRVA